jgi:hypothetical protein
MDTTNRDPKDDDVAKALLQALLEIHLYQSGRAPDELKQENIEALCATNVFSPQSTAFMKNHQARFHGFPRRVAPGIEVLDLVLPGKRFIGFSDGHVKREVRDDRSAIHTQDAE